MQRMEKGGCIRYVHSYVIRCSEWRKKSNINNVNPCDNPTVVHGQVKMPKLIENWLYMQHCAEKEITTQDTQHASVDKQHIYCTHTAMSSHSITLYIRSLVPNSRAADRYRSMEQLVTGSIEIINNLLYFRSFYYPILNNV